MLNNGLTLENISKRFASRPGSTTQLQVLDNIQLDIAPGEFISIVGASGCGKSTLLRLILGLDEEYDGRILINGKPIAGTGLERGIVFQDHRLFPWLNVEQNVAVGLKNSPLSSAEKRDTVREHIELVGLQDLSTLTRIRSPVAWHNGWQLPAGWSIAPAYCCLMSPWEPWMP